jgi:hypothetical protein
VDLFFLLYRTLKAFQLMVIREKQLGGFFRMLSRFISFIPYTFRHADKLGYGMFFRWFGYRDMTDGNSV